MGIFGTIIKAGIAIRQEFQSEIENPLEAQKEQLRYLLSKAESTSFGIYYGFQNILQAEDPVAAFQQKVPVHDYKKINERWWSQQQQESNITWKGKPDYFALSASTTGSESKRIPVTDDMLQSIRSVGLEQFTSLYKFGLPASFFEGDMMMLGSSTNLQEHEGHLEGEISGISASNLPEWFKGFYKPGLDISSIPDWDERIEEIAKKALDWNITGMSGIPSWVQLMLRRVMEYHQVENIHELWPNLQVYTTGGVAFEPYQSSFEEIFGKPVYILDTYLASEGFLAYTTRPDTRSMRLAIQHHIFFEFIPFDERGFDAYGNLLEEPLALTIDQLEEDKVYALLISTPAGAWRYMIGDTIKFTDLKKLEIVLTGRTKFWLNVAGSQLSEDMMNEAIQKLSEEMGVPINEFSVAAISIGEGFYKHQWILGSDKDFPEKEAGEKLDHLLQQVNKAYKMARTKALKAIEVKQISKDLFYSWLEKTKKKGGQVKTPKVLPDEQMMDFLKFINDN